MFLDILTLGIGLRGNNISRVGRDLFLRLLRAASLQALSTHLAPYSVRRSQCRTWKQVSMCWKPSVSGFDAPTSKTLMRCSREINLGFEGGRLARLAGRNRDPYSGATYLSLYLKLWAFFAFESAKLEMFDQVSDFHRLSSPESS